MIAPPPTPALAPRPVEPLALANGLRVVLLSDRRLPLVALELCFEAGSADEPARLAGLAHLCEHLAFLGTPLGSEDLPGLLRSRGGSANGSTFFGRSCFQEVLPSSELPVGLWVEARRLASRGGPIREPGLEVQRKILLQEHRQRVESRPERRALDDVQRLLYPADDPYHRPPGGSPEGLARISAADAEAFLDHRYIPANAVLTLCGDLDPEEMGSRIEEHLGAVPSVERPEPTLLPDLSDPAAAAEGRKDAGEERREVVTDRVSAVCTYLASRAPGWGQPLWYAASVLTWALASDRSSPLQRELIHDRGLARAVGAHLISMRRASTLAVTATAAPRVERQRLEEALLECAGRISRQGLEAETLRRARTKVEKVHHFRMQSLGYRAALANRLTSCFGDPGRLDGEAGRIRAVGEEEVRALGSTLFQPGHRVLLSRVPPGGDV